MGMRLFADLTVDDLNLDLLLEALRDRALYGPDLTVGEIGDFIVHIAVLRWFASLVLSRGP